MENLSRFYRIEQKESWLPDRIIDLPLLAITFGMASLHCRRNGICTYELLNSLPNPLVPLADRRAIVRLQLPNASENRPVLYFLKRSMSKATQKIFFPSAHFVLEESIELSVHRHLQVPGNCFLAAGRYPIVDLPDYYLVRFDQSPEQRYWLADE